MTTSKVRYEDPAGEFVKDIKFSESQTAMLLSIKNDDAFVSAIRNIAEVYVCRCTGEAEALSSGEFKATLMDLKQLASSLVEKLETMPQAVDAELWRFTSDPRRIDSRQKISKLKNLLHDFVEKTEDALELNSKSKKAGRKKNYANWYAAEMLMECFASFDLPIAPDQWMDMKMSSATKCLELIFLSAGTVLSRSSIETYIKPDKRKLITRKKG